VTGVLLRYRHLGGGGYVVDISGASREVTEGITALLAAAILLYVGCGCTTSCRPGAGRNSLKPKCKAHSRRHAVGIALVAFIAVYREVFETVLFLPGAVLQTATAARACGARFVSRPWRCGSVVADLQVQRAPAAQAVLHDQLGAAVRTRGGVRGKGIAAAGGRQAAGHQHRVPTIDLLGIYPNLQALGLQAALILAAVLSCCCHAARRLEGFPEKPNTCRKGAKDAKKLRVLRSCRLCVLCAFAADVRLRCYSLESSRAA